MEANNMKAMREALNQLLGLIDNGILVFAKGLELSDVSQAQYHIDKAAEEYEEPPRNCDKFDDLNTAQRYYIEHGCPKGLGMIVDGEIHKTPWKSQFEKWLFDKAKGETNEQK